MKRGFFIVCSFVLVLQCVHAQLPQRQTRPFYDVQVSGNVGIGLSWFRDQRSPLSPEEATFGYAALFKAQWHPSRLLTIGLLTGYVMFSRENFSPALKAFADTLTPQFAALYAIPIQPFVSMQKGGLEVGVAVGPYLMNAEIIDDDKMNGYRLEVGITSFASYQFVVSEDWRAGPELTFIYIGYRGLFMAVPQFRFTYTVLRY